jgi:hypothetical protein
VIHRNHQYVYRCVHVFRVLPYVRLQLCAKSHGDGMF